MLSNGSNGGAIRIAAVDDELASLIVGMGDAADAALCNNCIPSSAMGDGTAERVIARMNESSEGDEARRFDGVEDAGEDGLFATLKGRVEDMSKVTCIPLFTVVAVVDAAGVSSIGMDDGNAECVVARMYESSDEDKARRFDGGGVDAGGDGGSAMLKGRVDDMSKVTCIPLLAVANVEEAGVPQRPEAELVDDGAMSMNNEWFQP